MCNTLKKSQICGFILVDYSPGVFISFYKWQIGSHNRNNSSNVFRELAMCQTIYWAHRINHWVLIAILCEIHKICIKYWNRNIYFIMKNEQIIPFNQDCSINHIVYTPFKKLHRISQFLYVEMLITAYSIVLNIWSCSLQNIWSSYGMGIHFILLSIEKSTFIKSQHILVDLTRQLFASPIGPLSLRY